MSGFLRGSAGGVKRLRRQFHDIRNFLGRRPSNAGAKRPSWRATHIGSPATVDESLGISTACPLLSSMGPPFQKKSQNFQKASCGLRTIRIHHGHRRGGMLRTAGGRLAQLVERLVYTEDVGSSSLSSPTIFSLPPYFCRIPWYRSTDCRASKRLPIRRATLFSFFLSEACRRGRRCASRVAIDQNW